MDLSSGYLGLPLRSPVVASAGPLTGTVEAMQALADAGVGAIVMHSLFEEQLRSQIEQDALLLSSIAGFNAEALSYLPSDADENPQTVATAYLRLVEQASATVPVPIIASLNGSTLDEWLQMTRRLQDAGAAAVECNIYDVSGGVETIGEAVEQRHIDVAGAIANAVSIPVAVKLSPYFSSVGNVALRLASTGVKGLVLFNRFLQPDFDIDAIRVVPGVTLSHPSDAVLPRTWIAALRHQLPGLSLGGSSGVGTYHDVVAYLLAGADVVMTTSALIRHGAAHVSVLLRGVEQWGDAMGFSSVSDFRGKLSVAVGADSGLNRTAYVTGLQKASEAYGRGY